jgi:hypothetical protein
VLLFAAGKGIKVEGLHVPAVGFLYRLSVQENFWIDNVVETCVIFLSLFSDNVVITAISNGPSP